MDKYTPAGFSSDDGLSDDNEEEGDITKRPLSQSRSIHYTETDNHVALPPPGLAQASLTSPVNFMWTRDTCARRAPGLDPDQLRKKLIAPTPATSSNVPTMKTSPQASGEQSVVIKKRVKSSDTNADHLAWVQKVLSTNAGQSSAPRGSLEVDRMWLKKLVEVWSQKKGSIHNLSSQLMECWTAVVNPYTTALFIMENVHEFEGGKKLFIPLTKAFSSWLTPDNREKYSHCLDYSIKLQAFAMTLRDSVPCPQGMHAITTCFDLNQLEHNEQCVTLVKQLLDRKNFLKASACICALDLYRYFYVKEVALPLFFQGHINALDEYLAHNREHQVAFVELLDGFVHPDTNMDVVVSQSDVPKVSLDLLTRKNLAKTATRLMRNFKIPDDLCPNICHLRAGKALRYLFYRKYVERDIGDEQWEELMLSHVSDQQRALQLELIDMLVDYLDLDAAVKWSKLCKLPIESLPHQVASRLQSMSLNATATALDTAENGAVGSDQSDSTTQSDVSNGCYRLQLNDDQIHWVDTAESLRSCVNNIMQNGNVVGLDAEWRPTISQVYGGRMALLQLAINDAVFLLDAIALSRLLTDEDWRPLVENVLCNDELILVGYGIHEDTRLLMKTIPVLQDYLQQLKIADLMHMYNQIRQRCPDAFSSFSTSDDDAPSQQPTAKGEEKGLSDLVRLCLGRPLDKSQQMSDWERRPLRRPQITYAALDAFCLIKIYEILKSKIIEHKLPITLKPEYACTSKGAIKKTKLELRQERISEKCGKPEILSSQPKEPAGPAIAPGDFKIVCDTMLTGLGRHLRCCGVDVILVDGENASHDLATKIARQQERILLTSGIPFNTLKSHVPLGMCYNVVARHVRDQVSEVLKYFNVKVSVGDIFSRCQVCNGADYLDVHPLEMKQAWENDCTQRGLPLPSDYSSPQLVALPEGFDHLDLARLKLPNGVRVRVDKVPETMFSKVELFYVCANCGKVYWEGSHHERIQQQFAYILTDADS